MSGNRYLSVAVSMGKINFGARKIVLKALERKPVDTQGAPKKSGRILRDLGFITDDEHNEIMAEQRRRRAMGLSIQKFFSTSVPPLAQRMAVATLGLVVWFVLVLGFGLEAGKISSILSFLLIPLFLALEFRLEKSFWISAYKGVRLFIACALVVVAYLAATALYDLGSVVRGHSGASDSVVNAVEHRVFQLRLSLILLAATAFFLGCYSTWKFYALRFAEARGSAIKDMLTSLEVKLADLESVNDRYNVGVELLLKHLRGIISLSTSDHFLRKLLFWRRTPIAVSACYLELDRDREEFRISKAAWAIDAPEPIRTAYKDLETNHRPPMFNEEMFRKLVREAKGENEKGWKKRYLNNPERFRYVSACGWAVHEEKMIASGDAGRCLVFNREHLTADRLQARAKKDQGWFHIHSFMACPVEDASGEYHGVLMVMKNMKGGLPPEDAEAVLIVCQQLSKLI